MVARGEIVMTMEVIEMVVKKVVSKDNSHDECKKKTSYRHERL